MLPVWSLQVSLTVPWGWQPPSTILSFGLGTCMAGPLVPNGHRECIGLSGVNLNYVDLKGASIALLHSERNEMHVHPNARSGSQTQTKTKPRQHSSKYHLRRLFLKTGLAGE